MNQKHVIRAESRHREWDDLIQKMKESSLRNMNWNRDELYADRLRRFTNEGEENSKSLT